MFYTDTTCVALDLVNSDTTGFSELCWICVDKGCVHAVIPIAYCILKLPSIVLGLLNSHSNTWSKQISFVVARVGLKNKHRLVATITARHVLRRSPPGSMPKLLPSATAIRAGSAATKMSSQLPVFACRAPELALAAFAKR